MDTLSNDNQHSNLQSVGASVEKTLDDGPPQLCVFYLHCEVQGRRLLYAINRIHVALIMRQDMLKDSAVS